jgi:uncharacterized protein YfaS (alpha-2-macroglobulin family)
MKRMQFLFKTLSFPFVVVGKILVVLFGKVDWSIPTWLAYLDNLRKQSPVKFVAQSLVIIFLGGATYNVYDYYQRLPESILVDAVITIPELSGELESHDEDGNNLEGQSNKNPVPALYIEFAYTSNDYSPEITEQMPSNAAPELLRNTQIASTPSIMTIQYPSVAPIDLIGGEVKTGIKLSPHKTGKWRWGNDRTLIFIPETPWPAGQEYEVSFAPEVFESKDKFTDDEFSFITRPLQGRIEISEFELSVEDKLKQVYIEIAFNYPVDKQSVEQALSMAYQVEANKLGKAQLHTLSFSDDLLSATATLDVGTLPDRPRIVEIKFSQGIKSIYGGEATTTAYQSKVMVPDLYSYLKVEQSEMKVLRNLDDEPEQFVLLGFTDAIERQELVSKFTLYLLPKESDKNGKSYWQGPREVTTKVLNSAQKVDYVLMPNASDNAKNYQLKVDVQAGRQLYLKLEEGLTSANGFVQRAFFDRILVAPKYPQEIIIAGEGSVLTHSKDQRLAFSTRGIEYVQVSIGKVIDDELYHLVSQTQGDISNPSFYNWRFNETNLAQFNTQLISMNANSDDLKTANYASVDLNALVSNLEGGLGLFFVEIKAWDKKRNREIYGVSDKLLVLVTDLGVIVKTSQDESQDIFVQSITSGAPVAGAQIELIAKNGTKLFSKITDNLGHVTFPSAKGYEREQQPVVYVVKQKGDVSFIPYNRYTRQINYSRFNVGGEYAYFSDNERVNAYMFTDRGIYRPGETVNIGMIVKGKNLQNLGNIPLELVVRDAQYTEVYVEKIKLAQFGFVDASFITKKRFNTGTYTASLHLLRDRDNASSKRDRQVGSVNFAIEAFQADTMAITSQVKGLPNKGWTTSSTLTNEVTLNNLFGVPAQARKVASELVLLPIQFVFEEYKNVTFYSPQLKNDSTDGLSRINETLEQQKTNADGQAIVPIDLTRFTKGTYSVMLQTKGFEASGGRSVGTSARFLYSPSSYLLGYKADGKLSYVNRDSARSVALIAINNELLPVAMENLSKRLSKVQRISTLVKQYNGRYEYESIQKNELVREVDYALLEGFDELALDTSEAGTFVVDILTADGELLLSLEYTVVGATNDSGQLDKNAELKVTLEQGDYQEGDTIELSIQAPYAGSGLISIESYKLHTFKWFTSDTKSSVQVITIPKGIEGNAYVNVAFVRDIASKEIFTSPLSYAVVPFSIDRSKRVLDLDLTIEDIVQPGQPMTIDLDVSEDARVAVFAVDLGILQVASYRTPDPLAYFLKKRALNVRTMQILDLILPDFALSQMLSAAGGDMFADAIMSEEQMATGRRIKRSQNPFEREVQDPAVFWSGVVIAKKGRNTYTFDVPNDFAGGLRVMAIAVGEQTMGRAQQNTIVRGPFVLTPNVLNHAAPGDEFDITLNVANVVKDSLNNAAIEIQVSTSKHISIVGSDGAQIQLSENQEEAIRFRVKANDFLGGAKINFDVKTTDASGKTWHSTATATLSVRPAMPFVVNITTGVASNGKIAIDTPLKLLAPESNQLVKASTSPLVIAEGLSAYLAQYPHGCTEQIVSQVFPLVGLSNLAKYAPENETVALQFAQAISKLRQRQSYAGGFSYWPSAQDNDIDVTLYVMHFLIEAKALGYLVPQDMLASGLGYLDDTAANFVRSSGSNSSASLSLLTLRKHAQGIYLLTRSGVVTSNLLIDLVSTLNKQHKAAWRKDILSAYIAASYALMQQDKEARQLISEYDLSDQSELLKQSFAGLAPRLKLDAQYLFLVATHFPEHLKVISGQAILNITQAIYKGQYNTISAAYSTLALGAYHSAIYSGASNDDSQLATKSVNILNDELEKIDRKITFIASIMQKQMPLEVAYQPFATASYPIGTERVEATVQRTALQNFGGLYYVNMQAGYPAELLSEAKTNGIEVQRAFINKNGEIATNIKQGDEITVRLRVRSTQLKNIANMAIVDLLPGGFNVIRESVNRRSGVWQSDYIDVREDRIIFYGNITNRVTEMTYKVKVTAAGNFKVPASFAEAMYDRSLTGYSAASTVKVTALGKSDDNF